MGQYLKLNKVSLPPSAQIGEHNHAEWELSIATFGKGIRKIGESCAPFSTEEAVLIPPGVSHCWTFDSGFTDENGEISNITLSFDNAVFDKLNFLFPGIGDTFAGFRSLRSPLCFTGDAYRRIYQLMERMADVSEASRLGLFILMVDFIGSVGSAEVISEEVPKNEIERTLDRIRIFMECNYMNRITLDDASKLTGMGKSSFCSFLRRHKGLTFSSWLNQIRISRASKSLVNSNKSVAQIAYDCGYSSVPYFNRQFIRYTGMSPTHFRNQNLVF